LLGACRSVAEGLPVGCLGAAVLRAGALDFTSYVL